MPCAFCGHRTITTSFIKYWFLNKHYRTLDVLPYVRKVLRLNPNICFVDNILQKETLQHAYHITEICTTCFNTSNTIEAIPITRMQTTHMELPNNNLVNSTVQRVLAPIQPFLKIQRKQKTGLYSTMPVKHKDLTISYFYDLYNATHNDNTITMLTSQIYFNQNSLFPSFVAKEDTITLQTLYSQLWNNNTHYRSYILELQDSTSEVINLQYRNTIFPHLCSHSEESPIISISNTSPSSPLQSTTENSPYISISNTTSSLGQKSIPPLSPTINNDFTCVQRKPKRINKIIDWHVDENNEERFKVKWTDNTTTNELAQDIFINADNHTLLVQFLINWNIMNPTNQFESDYVTKLQSLQAYQGVFKILDYHRHSNGALSFKAWITPSNITQWIPFEDLPQYARVHVSAYVTHHNMHHPEDPIFLYTHPNDNNIEQNQDDIIQDQNQMPVTQQPHQPELLTHQQESRYTNNPNLFHYCIKGIAKDNRLFLNQYNVEALSFPFLFPTTWDVQKTWNNLHNLDQKRRLPFSKYSIRRIFGWDKRFSEDLCYLYTLFYAKQQMAIAYNAKYQLKVRANITAAEQEIHFQQTKQDLLQTESGKICKNLYIRRLFQRVPPFPPYFINRRWNLRNAVAQLGPPQLFLTLSLSEKNMTKRFPLFWEEAVYFSNAKRLTPSQITYNETAYQAFIQHIYLEQIIEEFINIMKHKNIKIHHYFRRIEFQKRGTPHIHAVFWSNDLPPTLDSIPQDMETAHIINQWNNAALQIFQSTDQSQIIDTSCQIHTHYDRCQNEKTPGRICKWNFPRLPIQYTETFLPHDIKYNRKTTRRKIKDWQFILQTLYSTNEHITLTWPKWLQLCNCQNYHQYTSIIKQSINRPTIYHQRNFTQIFLCDYIPEMLQITQSNMDIQLILSTQAAYNYITKYISKEEPIEISTNIFNSSHSLSSLAFRAQEGFLNRRISLQEALFTINHRPPCRNTWNTIHDYSLHHLSEDKQFIEVKRPSQLLLNPDHFIITNTTSIRRHNHYASRSSQASNKCYYQFLMEITNDSKPHNLPNVVQCSLPTDFKESDNFSMYFYFYPWRDIHILKTWQDCTTTEKQIILSNAKNLRPFDPRWNNFGYFDFTSSEGEDTISEHSYSSDEDEEMKPHNYINFCQFDNNVDLEDNSTDPQNNEHKPHSPNQVQPIRPSHNLEQAAILFLFQQWVKTDRQKPLYWICLGPGGTGKSFIIDQLTNILNNQLLLEGYSTKEVHYVKLIKAAYTGIAAHNINGNTLHSFFETTLIDPNKQTLTDFEQKFKELEVIIIDEVSMLQNTYFNNINTILQESKNDLRPFGGVSVLLFGDFDQIPPIGDYNIQHNHLLLNNFQLFHLSINVRQQNDANLLKILHEVRTHNISDSSLELLQQRQQALTEINPNDIEHFLFRKNDIRIKYNKQRVLNQTPTTTAIKDQIQDKTFTMIISAKPFRNQTKRPNTHRHKNPFHTIPITIDAKVMLLANLDVPKGFTNGTLGIITGIKVDQNNLAKEIKFTTTNNNPRSIIIKREGFSKKRKRCNFNKQLPLFPIDLAWGITIHKCQGKTFHSKIAIDCQTLNEYSQLYVALSRSTNLNNIYLANFQANKIKQLINSSPPTTEIKLLTKNISLLSGCIITLNLSKSHQSSPHFDYAKAQVHITLTTPPQEQPDNHRSDFNCFTKKLSSKITVTIQYTTHSITRPLSYILKYQQQGESDYQLPSFSI